MTKDQIKALQTQLNAKGANLTVDGILGPKTQSAMTQFQTQASAPSTGAGTLSSDQVKALQTALNQSGAGLKVDGILGPQTQAAMNAAVSKSVASNPVTAPLVAQNGGNPAAIINAYQTGDWSGVTNVTGQPFTADEQQAALTEAQNALAPAYREQSSNDLATTENSLGIEQDSYQNFLNSQGKQFTTDKNTQDEDAATNGVLFSGSRVQKLNDLKSSYDTAQQQQAATVGRQIAGTAQNYQYKYGNDAANTLSSYYNLGGNAYNPGVATGGVTKGSSLSSYYNPSAYNYQGTAVNANNANAQTRAAALLANKANKLLPSGYNTQL